MRRLPRTAVAAALAAIALGGWAMTVQAQSEDQTQAMQAEQHWLHLVDTGQYGPAWQTQAKAARDAVPQDRFVSIFKATRTPLGALKSRVLESAESRTTLPGAPDGHYVVVHYTSSFANKGNTTETVTAQQQPDGSWRVDGYYIL